MLDLRKASARWSSRAADRARGSTTGRDCCAMWETSDEILHAPCTCVPVLMNHGLSENCRANQNRNVLKDVSNLYMDSWLPKIVIIIIDWGWDEAK